MDIDQLVSDFDKLSFTDRAYNDAQPTKAGQAKIDLCGSMEGIESTKPTVRDQQRPQSTRVGKSDQSPVCSSEAGIKCPSKTSENANDVTGYNTERNSYCREQLFEEGTAVARYWFKGCVSIIYRHGSDEMYKYEMERTEIRDRDWMRHIPPVCSDIQSILNIRNQENPTRRLYNYFNIQDIIGVAVPYNANDQANGAHSSETTLKCLKLTGVCALVLWQNIKEEHLRLFCGKESWMPRSAIYSMTTTKMRPRVNEKILDAYRKQIERYEKRGKERKNQSGITPLSFLADNGRKQGKQNPGQKYVNRKQRRSTMPELFSPCTVTDAAGNGGGHSDLPNGLGPDADLIREAALEQTSNATLMLAKDRKFSYKTYLDERTAWSRVNDALKARLPKEHALRLDIILAEWPSHKKHMIAGGFQEVGESPDEDTTARAKARALADDTVLLPPGWPEE